MKLAAPLLIAALAAALLAGCGSSDEEETQRTANAPTGASAAPCDTYAVDVANLRVTRLSCKQGRQVMFGWQRAEGCGLIGSASRGACSVRSYRCLAIRADRGISVSCAQPGRSVAFVAKRG
jgi:hypothetical protein